ncbi:MAG: hypothetical protein ABT940_09555, partial [Alphaproteobacteria bacterium]
MSRQKAGRKDPARPRETWRWLLAHTPLPLRMVLASLSFGGLLMVGLDAVRTPILQNQFRESRMTDLKEPAAGDRMRFDQAIRQEEQLAVIFSTYAPLRAYLANVGLKPQINGQPSTWRDEPPWLLPRSLLRTFITPNWMVLLDPQGRPREIYNSTDTSIPVSLLHQNFREGGVLHTHITRVDG